MPNWCNTDITIKHEDKALVKALYDKIEDWTSRDYKENDFGNGWLGNVVLGSGIDADDLRYRGMITSCELADDSIILWTETAWGPMVKMWQRIVDRYLPGAEITFSAEEPGNGIYETNDSCYDGLYVIDIWGDQPDGMLWDSQWEASEETVKKFCQEALKTEETDIEKLLEMAAELDWVAINRWELCKIEDCE